MIDKKFLNSELAIELNSYIDNKQNVWFRGNDVAKILGYKNTDDAIRRHVSTENKMSHLLNSNCCPGKKPGQVRKSCPRETRGQVQGRWFTFINEPGFYELVFSSKLEFAKKFRQWVFTTVLPSIRKFGYYKLFKIEGKNRVIIDGKKYYKHPVFSNYAASKNGDIMSLRNKKF